MDIYSFFSLLILRIRRLDSIIFTGLAAVSSSVIFWFPILEWHAFGALSIILAIAVIALNERGVDVPWWVYLLASISTLSIMSTNWMAGLFMLFLSLPLKKALKFAAVTIGIVGLLWVVEKIIFPTSGFPFLLFTKAETMYMFNETSQGLNSKLYVFFFHSIIMPEIGGSYGYRLSVQSISPSAGSLLTNIGIILWFILFIFSSYSFIRYKKSKTCIMLLLTITCQLLLAIVFGIETFFYSVNWGPLLVLFCALGTLTPIRKFTVPIATCLIIISLVNNFYKFNVSALRLQYKYSIEKSFSVKGANLTDPNSLIISGRHICAVEGESPWDQDPKTAQVVDLCTHNNERDCFFIFDDLQVHRRGWNISYEEWKINKIEAFRQRGAKYFVTSNGYGIEHKPEFFKEMDLKYHRLEKTSHWAFYDLSNRHTLRRNGCTFDKK